MNQSDLIPKMSVSASTISLEPRSRSLVAALVAVEVDGILLRVKVKLFRNSELGIEYPTLTNGDDCLAAVELPAKVKAEVEEEVLTLFGAAEDQENIAITELKEAY